MDKNVLNKKSLLLIYLLLAYLTVAVAPILQLLQTAIIFISVKAKIDILVIFYSMSISKLVIPHHNFCKQKCEND